MYELASGGQRTHVYHACILLRQDRSVSVKKDVQPFPAVYVGTEDSDSHRLACGAGALPMEPSPQPTSRCDRVTSLHCIEANIRV